MKVVAWIVAVVVIVVLGVWAFDHLELRRVDRQRAELAAKDSLIAALTIQRDHADTNRVVTVTTYREIRERLAREAGIVAPGGAIVAPTPDSGSSVSLKRKCTSQQDLADIVTSCDAAIAADSVALRARDNIITEQRRSIDLAKRIAAAPGPRLGTAFGAGYEIERRSPLASLDTKLRLFSRIEARARVQYVLPAPSATSRLEGSRTSTAVTLQYNF